MRTTQTFGGGPRDRLKRPKLCWTCSSSGRSPMRSGSGVGRQDESSMRLGLLNGYGCYVVRREMSAWLLSQGDVTISLAKNVLVDDRFRLLDDLRDLRDN